jgi:hypothetical protein
MKLFRSKIDPYCLLFLVVLLLVIDAAAISLAAQALTATALLSSITLYGLLLGLPSLLLLLVFPVRYAVTSRDLIIQSGFLRRRIPLNTVHLVTPTHNLIPAPALSMTRLHIKYQVGKKTKSTYISPADQNSVIQAMTAADPGLIRERDELVRYSSGKIIYFSNLSR